MLLHVGTLIMLLWKCGAILSLVSGIELRFILHEYLPPQLALYANLRFSRTLVPLD